MIAAFTYLKQSQTLLGGMQWKDVRQKINRKQNISMRNKGTTIHSEGGQALEEMHSEAVGSPSLEVLKT